MLKNPPRQPAASFKEFVTEDVVRSALTAHNEEQNRQRLLLHQHAGLQFCYASEIDNELKLFELKFRSANLKNGIA
ncbi:hypothetical protein Cyrtocomes_00144 [Candidatus Cyrtobacter comes]|uniref:Uncharacterized protein n=1 Tax=Candidatus Cyrtobacter comes TaxID=675776 RepID=A0ABU5L6N6_9RICK|nr:hypothetical protein [Candidatus Cyrtobacter comes]